MSCKKKVGREHGKGKTKNGIQTAKWAASLTVFGFA